MTTAAPGFEAAVPPAALLPGLALVLPAENAPRAARYARRADSAVLVARLAPLGRAAAVGVARPPVPQLLALAPAHVALVHAGRARTLEPAGCEFTTVATKLQRASALRLTTSENFKPFIANVRFR